MKRKSFKCEISQKSSTSKRSYRENTIISWKVFANILKNQERKVNSFHIIPHFFKFCWPYFTFFVNYFTKVDIFSIFVKIITMFYCIFREKSLQKFEKFPFSNSTWSLSRSEWWRLWLSRDCLRESNQEKRCWLIMLTDWLTDWLFIESREFLRRPAHT